MTVLKSLRSVADQAAGSAHPHALLALATTIVFAIALGVSWTSRTEAQCTSGSSYCLWIGAPNACNTQTSCTPSGYGYTCIAQNKVQDEGYYKVVPATSWQNCFYEEGSPKSCTATWQSCGTTNHYISGHPGCLSYSCVGNWYWASCWGTGDIC